MPLGDKNGKSEKSTVLFTTFPLIDDSGSGKESVLIVKLVLNDDLMEDLIRVC